MEHGTGAESIGTLRSGAQRDRGEPNLRPTFGAAVRDRIPRLSRDAAPEISGATARQPEMRTFQGIRRRRKAVPSLRTGDKVSEDSLGDFLGRSPGESAAPLFIAEFHADERDRGVCQSRLVGIFAGQE